MARKRTLLSTLMRVTIAVAGGIVTIWTLGFLTFFLFVASEDVDAPGKKADVIVVLTGGTGRIEEGFRLMADDGAKAMLVTGVHPNVTLPQLIERSAAAEARGKLGRHCCIFIEHKALSTEENAAETLAWLNRNGGPQGVTMRLVTSDYHLPRARLLFSRTLPEVTIYETPVASNNKLSGVFWRMVFTEYSKTFLTWIS